MNAEIEALQNSADGLRIFMRIKEYFENDRRRTVKKYVAVINKTSVSPPLNYDKLNYFLLGWHKSKKYTEV